MLNCSDFLRTLYPDGSTGHLAIFTLPARKVIWCPVSDLQQASRAVDNLSRTQDVYFGVGVHAEPLGRGSRGTAATVRSLPGLWVDIDIRGPAHRHPDLPPTFEDAIELLGDAAPAPTLLVHSGHGVHAWWLTQESWTFAGEEDRRRAQTAAAEFQAGVRYVASMRGWHVDDTSDLARVLRPPGSYNRKLEPIEVRVLSHMPECRYSVSEILTLGKHGGSVLMSSEVQAVQYALGESVDEGERHHRLVRGAGILISRGMSPDKIAVAVRNWNQGNRPPLPQPEVERTLSDFIRRYGGTAGPVRIGVPCQPPAREDDIGLPRPVCALGAPAPESPSWRVANLWIAGEVGLIVGDGGGGKTTFAITLAAAVSGGYPLLDHRPFETARCPVLYVSEEDPQSILLNRLNALITGHGWDPSRVKQNFHLLAEQGVSLDSEAWRSHLLRLVKEMEIGLVVLDPLAALTLAKENVNDEAKHVTAFMRELCRAGASVALVHHFGKAVEGKRKLDRIRGASAYNSAARIIYSLDATEQGFKLECLKLSKAARPAPFSVRREIVAEPTNPAVWKSARLVQDGPASPGEKGAHFILKQLQVGMRLTTTELKARAKGTGVSGQDISQALVELETNGKIDFEGGDHGAKLWGLRLPESSGNQHGNTLPTLPDFARQVLEGVDDVALPF